jgi:hypothetical protein
MAQMLMKLTIVSVNASLSKHVSLFIKSIVVTLSLEMTLTCLRAKKSFEVILLNESQFSLVFLMLKKLIMMIVKYTQGVLKREGNRA